MTKLKRISEPRGGYAFCEDRHCNFEWHNPNGIPVEKEASAARRAAQRHALKTGHLTTVIIERRTYYQKED